MPDRNELTLKRLTEEVIGELHSFIETPDLEEDAIDDFIWETADESTPTHYDTALKMAADNSGIYSRQVEAGLLEFPTPFNVTRLAIFDYLKEVLWDEWRRIQEQNA